MAVKVKCTSLDTANQFYQVILKTFLLCLCSGKAVMHTKKLSSTGEAWSPCVVAEGAPSTLLLKHPVKGPCAVQKDFAKLNLNKLMHSILSAREFLEAPEVEKWNNFLLHLDGECKAGNTNEASKQNVL